MITARTVPSTLLISLVAALGAAACGGSKKSATTGPTAPTGDTAALGTTGLEGLDWGASTDAVLAAFPAATPTDGGLWAIGMTDRHQSLTKFLIGADGVDEVRIEWVEGYISMEDCAKGWTEIRAKVDTRLGPSKQDNLAAYWNTPTASVTLACNPNDIDNGSAVLSQSFVPHHAE